MPSQMWVVRAGRNTAFVREFLDQSMVAIGWAPIGDLTNVHGRQAIAALVTEHFPEYNKFQHMVSAGQLYRFRDELIVGTPVCTYDSGNRLYHLGTVSGDYRYQPSLNPHLRHTRAVSWNRTVDRDSLTAKTKSGLGSIATIFRISEAATAELSGSQSYPNGTVDLELDAPDLGVDQETEVRKDTEQRALEFLQDRLSLLTWDQMQDLVAGLLRGMGYKTRVSPAGPDRGRDIIASPDGFGFQPPRILVEVKHRKGAMGAPDIRSFTGGLRAGDNGLYVSTGGFTREARYEAERANHHLTLMDSTDLGDAIIEYYDNMDLETRSLLPLKKIYWPV